MDQHNLPGTIKHEVSIGEWMITMLITALPLIGLIMLFVWAFGGDTHPSKKTFAQVSLLFNPLPLLGIVIAIILAFSSNTEPNMKTFAQAYLILSLIFIVLVIIFIIMFWTFISAMFSGLGGTYS